MNSNQKYNPNIHHRKSIRLKGYDYSQAGLYFITICCQNRACLFGEIVGANNYSHNTNNTANTGNGIIELTNNPNVGANNYSPVMELNDAGKIANDCWLEIPNHFPYANLYEHIIMPNHLHGIIELTNNPDVGANNYSHNTNNTANTGNGANNYSPLPQPFTSPSKTIGSIVRGFKIGVTKWFRQNTDVETVWQRNYHEHIIRNEKSYHTISEYIKKNPAKWADDKFYTI